MSRHDEPSAQLRRVGTARRRSRSRGQSLVELALALPILLLLVLGTVDLGRAFFDYIQMRNGAFGSSYGASTGHTGITALAGIAFMSAGNLPGRGKYGEVVRKAVEFELKNSQESGLLAADRSNGLMYSHGFATLFLGEVYGMTGDEEV